MAIHGEGIEIHRHHPRNLWKDAVIGMAAGVAGTMAMGRFWSVMSSLSSDGRNGEARENAGNGTRRERDDAEGSWSPAGGSDAPESVTRAAAPASGAEARGDEAERRADAADGETAGTGDGEGVRSERGGDDGGRGEEQRAGDGEDEGPLDDIAVVGPFHREEESSPETLARVAYTKVRGREPSAETRKTLAGQIHWATGMGLGMIYGLLRGETGRALDLRGGLLFGAGAWFVNDEILVPMLGLSEGPTAHELDVHAKALGAHVVYGLATAATAQVLERVL